MNSAWLCSKLPCAQSYFSVISHSACCKWLTSLTLSLSPLSLFVSSSLPLSLSVTSVTNWRELHTNCVSLWQCSLPASQSACVFSPIKPHCCIITVGPHLLSWYFLVTLQCSNTCRRHGGWKEGLVKYLYASWVEMRWDGNISHQRWFATAPQNPKLEWAGIENRWMRLFFFFLPFLCWLLLLIYQTCLMCNPHLIPLFSPVLCSHSAHLLTILNFLHPHAHYFHPPPLQIKI